MIFPVMLSTELEYLREVLGCLSLSQEKLPSCIADYLPLYDTSAYFPDNMPKPAVLFHCLDVRPRPWSKLWDFDGDGYLGTGDMVMQQYFGNPGRARAQWQTDADYFNSFIQGYACITVQADDIVSETLWKIQEVIARGSDRTTALQDIMDVQTDATNRLTLLKSVSMTNEGEKNHFGDTIANRFKAVDEYVVNAIRFLNGGAGQFGAGVSLMPVSGGGGGYPFQVTGIHAASVAAAAGVLRGDAVVAVDGELCVGKRDPETGAMVGFAGIRHSVIRLTIRRQGYQFDVSFPREVWISPLKYTANRTLGAANDSSTSPIATPPDNDPNRRHP